MKRDYYAEGRAAYAAGMTYRNNPYRYGTPRHEWARGQTDGWKESANQARRESEQQSAAQKYA